VNVNPFDPKSILLAKHAQHVVLIHFPIALFIMGACFDFIAARTKNPALQVAAYYNIAWAAVFTIPVIVTGLLAWHFALEGASLKGILLWHLLAAVTATVLIATVARLHLRSHREKTTLPAWRLPLEAVTVLVIGLTAHLGGFLSGVN